MNGIVSCGRQMQEACSKDPYNPEDHLLTSEEMWAGFSSEEENGAEAKAGRFDALGRWLKLF